MLCLCLLLSSLVSVQESDEAVRGLQMDSERNGGLQDGAEVEVEAVVGVQKWKDLRQDNLLLHTLHLLLAPPAVLLLLHHRPVVSSSSGNVSVVKRETKLICDKGQLDAVDTAPPHYHSRHRLKVL